MFLYENKAPHCKQAAIVFMETSATFKKEFLCIPPWMHNCTQNLKGGWKFFISQDVWFLQTNS